MKTVIMAGGKGTRISSVNNEIPKPLIKVCGKPVLERQINCLKRQNITDITIVVGYLKERITDYFGDGKKFGIHITYVEEKYPLGTAGALYYFHNINEEILLLNGDLLFDIDLMSFIEYHRGKKAEITVFSHPNNHPFDSTLLQVDDTSKVIEILTKESKKNLYQNRVNAGIHLLAPSVLTDFKDCEKKDLDRDILPCYVKKGTMYAYDSPEYVKDMGTPERYYEVCNDWERCLPFQKNRNNKQKVVFLDRDGTINVHKGFLTDIDQFELYEEAAEAIKEINDAGYMVLVVTNQPVIARGECTFNNLKNIHKKMEVLLGEKGAYIDDIFICPHHPDAGYAGEISKLKIKCMCRKPNPGLLFQAAQKYNINLAGSFMIGDSNADIEAGKNAGCRTLLVRDGLKKNEIIKVLDEMNNS